MKLEQGKSYVTRKGEVTSPLKKKYSKELCQNVFLGIIGNEICRWRENGMIYENGQDRCDLVSENTKYAQQKQAGSIGGKATGDKKRRDMSNKSRRVIVQETAGIPDSVNIGYEIGLSKEVSRACRNFFNNRGIQVTEYNPYF